MNGDRVIHTIDPVFAADSRVLLLGSIPSPKSREQGFFYGHPRNRMWRVLARVFEAPFPETVEERRAFLLAHAGVGAYEPEKPLEDCVLHDFIWERMNYRKTYYKNKLLVTGHTPTAFIDPGCAGQILRRNHHICVDCGAVYCGTLGCVCLETLEEFYVS